MNDCGITIAYLSRVTGVSSKTIAGYVRLLRPIALELDDGKVHRE
ncbi:MAG TPA: hypothetical protein VLU91_05430 [Nitrososphaerales archaeon]|nr:hypothetical protein [Nitrososphaerales archaeon]